jgi:AbrB family looped-hinge helix DNA binding protein
MQLQRATKGYPMNGFFKGKIYGVATIGERGQIVIPADVRKSLKVKPGDKLIVLFSPDRKLIRLIPEEDFNNFLKQASKFVSQLEKKVANKSKSRR